LLAETLEQGRRPFYITVSCAVAVALSAVARFVLMVWALQPAEYGLLTLFTTINTILPAILILGTSLQLQRIVRQVGLPFIPFGLRRGVAAILWTAGPSFVVLSALLLPYISSWSSLLTSCLLAVVISAATGVCSFCSQVLLGVGYRAVSAMVMLGANTVLTATLLLPELFDDTTTVSILAWWAAGSLLVAVCTYLMCMTLAGSGRIEERSPGKHLELHQHGFSYREGIASIPSIIGPWLLAFVVKYFIGINLGPEVLSTFAIASTVSDTAFLVAVSLVTYSSNNVLDGTINPYRVFAWSALALSVLAAIGIALVPEVLVLLSRTQYKFELVVAAVLAVSAVARLMILSWRNRLLAERLMKLESVSYLVGSAVVTVGLVIARPTELLVYPVVLAIAYGAIALVQQVAVFRMTRSRAADSTRTAQ
jgi:hypothetical protein